MSMKHSFKHLNIHEFLVFPNAGEKLTKPVQLQYPPIRRCVAKKENVTESIFIGV